MLEEKLSTQGWIGRETTYKKKMLIKFLPLDWVLIVDHN